MDKLVVDDASVTIKWLNPHEPLAAQANAIRSAFATGELRFGPEIPVEYLRQLVSDRRGSYRLSILDGGREAV